MAELVFDLVEEILVKLNVKDLLRYKSVCKSWQSLISSRRFIKSHLNHTSNNCEFGQRRILTPINSPKYEANRCNDWRFWCTRDIAGSSNGLVCMSFANGQVKVTNPSTREVKKMQTRPEFHGNIFSLFCGFGYDSYTDDYKFVIGIMKNNSSTLFQVLTLKSNSWKVIGEVSYMAYRPYHDARFGILFNGVLHWFMNNQITNKKVILCFDLYKDQFNEIPLPDNMIYVCDRYNRLGIIEQRLCIFRTDPPYHIWIMKNYNAKQSWELLSCDCEMKEYDVLHTLERNIPHNSFSLCDEDDICLTRNRKYMGAPIFVHSLVSPHMWQTLEIYG